MKTQNTKKFIKAKKSLGQNFLKSIPALKKIIEAGEIKEGEIILEIGPGKGALTKYLLDKSSCVVAIEKDKRMIEFLKEKFQKEIDEKKLILLEKDILDLEIKDFKKNKENYKIIANIPYNITGAILKKFLTEENQPEKMVLMVQKEVAERIAKQDNKKPKENLLSISVKAYGTPKIIMKVPKRYFSPMPKVDSAILKIENISKKLFIDNQIKEEDFWEIVHLGFAHKRKTLIKNLEKHKKNLSWLNIFNQLNIKTNNRAEDLQIDDWIRIIKNSNI